MTNTNGLPSAARIFSVGKTEVSVSTETVQPNVIKHVGHSIFTHHRAVDRLAFRLLKHRVARLFAYLRLSGDHQQRALLISVAVTDTLSTPTSQLDGILLIFSKIAHF